MTKCNIIIPTYERPAYLRRILNYYSDCGKDFKIIVADSSSDENKKVNKEIISSVSNLDIQYLDDYPAKISPYHKIADAVNHADEKYCALCADDDFVTPDGINQSVDFLEKNLDFAIAHGRYVSFHFEDDERGKQQFYWKPIYSQESIAFPDPETRLSYHLSNYLIATFYAVHRTDFMKMILKETVKFTNYDRFGELLLSMLALIYGKMKCLDVLYAARDYFPSSSGQTSKSIRGYMKDGTYGEKYAKFRDCLSTHLRTQTELDVEESEKIVDDAMPTYMKKYSPFNPLISKMENILDNLRLPDWIDKKIRALYRVLFLTKQKADPSFSLGISPSYEYYDDLNKIRLHVLSYLEE